MERGKTSRPAARPGGWTCFLRWQAPDSSPGDIPKSDELVDAREKQEIRLFCRHCLHAITTPAARITVDGAHNHTFTNPAGITFRIGCFGEAPGCNRSGVPTFAHTWFAAHAWSFASCAGCGAHLGWHYSSGSDGFFGLILTELVEGTEY